MLNNVRMVEPPQHFNLSLDFLKYSLLPYPPFIQNFDSYFMLRDLVGAQFYTAEGAHSQVFAQFVITDD